MKISTEQLAALQESDIQRKKQHPQGTGFDAVLNQLGSTSAQGVDLLGGGATALAHANTATPLAGVLGTPADAVADSPDADLLQTLAVQLDGIFNKLDAYAGQLANPKGATLREAHAGLAEMRSELAALKTAHPQLSTQLPEMAGLVNELDVVTTTEMFKLNRGDYL